MRTTGSLLLLGQALDCLTYVAFVVFAAPLVTGVAERNPVTIALTAAGGLALFALVKVGYPAFLGWRLWRARPSRLLRLIAGAAAVSGFVGAFFNTVAIVRVLG